MRNLNRQELEDRKGLTAPQRLEEGVTAVKALEESIGRQFFALVPTEIGGGNTAFALGVAARCGLPIVDADPSGRSVPECQHTTYNVMNMPITPVSAVTSKNDVIILQKASDDVQVEKIIRGIAVANDNHIMAVDHPLDGRSLKKSVIPRTVSKALMIGRAVRQACIEGTNPVQAAITAGNGFSLFQGEVSKVDWKIESGLTLGNIHIEGQQENAGHRYRIWYENENILSWYDGDPDVMAPNLICVLDPSTGHAITNPNCQEGMHVAVVGYVAPELWRLPRGLELFGPRSFGYDVDYRKIEDNPRLQCSAI